MVFEPVCAGAVRTGAVAAAPAQEFSFLLQWMEERVVAAEDIRTQLDFTVKYTRSLGLLEDWAEQLSLQRSTESQRSCSCVY